MSFWRLALEALAVGVLGSWGVACSAESPSPPRCPSPGPAFFVAVARSDGAALPADLRLRVTYGSGVEQYQHGEPSLPKVLFCSSKSADAVDTHPSTRIECELWTHGPATLEIESAELPKITRELTPDPELCTRHEDIDLLERQSV